MPLWWSICPFGERCGARWKFKGAIGPPKGQFAKLPTSTPSHHRPREDGKKGKKGKKGEKEKRGRKGKKRRKERKERNGRKGRTGRYPSAANCIFGGAFAPSANGVVPGGNSKGQLAHRRGNSPRSQPALPSTTAPGKKGRKGRKGRNRRKGRNKRKGR